MIALEDDNANLNEMVEILQSEVQTLQQQNEILLEQLEIFKDEVTGEHNFTLSTILEKVSRETQFSTLSSPFLYIYALYLWAFTLCQTYF